MRSHVALLAAILLAGTVSAQSPTAPAEPPAASRPVTDDIVVEGRTQEGLDRFVGSLTVAEGDDQLARWNGALCLQVLGIDAAHADLIRERYASLAKTDDLVPIDRHCAPNVLIVFAEDAEAFTRSFIDRHPALFRDPNYGIAHAADFKPLLVQRAVRWIRGTRTTGAFVRPGGASLNPQAIFAPGLGSRIGRDHSQSTIIEMLIVDEGQLAHVTWGQLADYLAFATFVRAPLQRSSDPATILSLFTARDAGHAGSLTLTPSDHAVLRGLYHSDGSLGAVQQRAQIRNRIQRDLHSAKR